MPGKLMETYYILTSIGEGKSSSQSIPSLPVKKNISLVNKNDFKTNTAILLCLSEHV